MRRLWLSSDGVHVYLGFFLHIFSLVARQSPLRGLLSRTWPYSYSFRVYFNITNFIGSEKGEERSNRFFVRLALPSPNQQYQLLKALKPNFGGSVVNSFLFESASVLFSSNEQSTCEARLSWRLFLAGTQVLNVWASLWGIKKRGGPNTKKTGLLHQSCTCLYSVHSLSARINFFSWRKNYVPPAWLQMFRKRFPIGNRCIAVYSIFNGFNILDFSCHYYFRCNPDFQRKRFSPNSNDKSSLCWNFLPKCFCCSSAADSRGT